MPSESPGKTKYTEVGSLIPSPGDLPNPGIKLGSPALQVDSLLAELPGKYQKSLSSLILCTYISFNLLVAELVT